MQCLKSIQVVPCATVPSNTTSASTEPIDHYFLATLEKSANVIPDYLVLDASGKIKIRIRVNVMGIYNVDTVSQSFRIKLWVQFKWPVSSLNDETCQWKPHLDFVNNLEEIQISDEKTRHKPHGDLTNVYYSYILQGTFAEKFELERFPLDFQLLQVRSILWNCPQYITKKTNTGIQSIECARPVTFYNGGSLIFTEAFIQRDSWKMYDKVFIVQGKTLAERNEDGVQYATLDIKICLWRSCNFYIYNFVVPIFLMVLLSFVSFATECSDFADRMQIDLTLVLTLAAFKYATAQYIPTMSYLTYLDKYIIASFLYITLVTGQSVLCYSLAEEIQSVFNRISAIVFLVTWFAVNILCGIYVTFLRVNTIKGL